MTGSSGKRSGGAALVVAAWIVQLAGAATPPSEAALWQQIETLYGALAEEDPNADWFAAAEQGRHELLEPLRTYVNVYPGGAHRLAVTALELETLYELGALDGGDLSALCRRSAYLFEHADSESIRAEAAYWRIFCRDRAATTQPATTQPAFAAAPTDLLQHYADYVAAYPASRHTPRLTSMLFDAAETRGDEDAMAALVTRMQTHFPAHAMTGQLAAVLRRARQVGKVFPLRFTESGDSAVDPNTLGNGPLAIVVWTRFDEPSVAAAREVEQCVAAHPGASAVGINLDPTTELARQAAREVGLKAPQINDGGGWATWFVRHWGVRRLPAVFVVDGKGRLLGVSEGEGWRALLERACAQIGQD